jgi:hypothetical protein
MAADADHARSLYERAVDLGHKASAHNLGLFWEGALGSSSADIRSDRQRAIQMYRRGGGDSRCQRLVHALR